MMKTKTINTPLMMAAAFGPTSCTSGLVPKSKLLHSPEDQNGFVPKLSLHGGKNPALRAEKPFFARLRLSESITMLASVMPNGSRLERSSVRSFFSGAQRSGVFASEDVLRCGAMCGDVVAGAGACSQAQSHDSGTEARRAKTSPEVFLRFL
jgi:hypothetical protein